MNCPRQLTRSLLAAAAIALCVTIVAQADKPASNEEKNERANPERVLDKTLERVGEAVDALRGSGKEKKKSDEETIEKVTDTEPDEDVTTKEPVAMDGETSPGAYLAQFPIPKAWQPTSGPGKKALVIRIDHGGSDMIDGYTAYTLRRAERRVRKGDIGAVILDLNTPGGQVSASYECRDALSDMKPVVTTCFVNRRAVSGGALLMLACQNIYVSPDSWCGDAQQIMIMPTKEGQKVTSSFGDEAVDEKMTIGLRTEFETTAKANGHRVDIARAFSDRRESIPGLNAAGIILHLTAEEAIEHRLAIAEAASIGDVLEQLGIPDAEVEHFDLSRREYFAFFTKTWAWLFLALSAACVWIEIKAPGFGVPGFLAGFFLAVFFWANFMAMTASWYEIALFVAGLGLLGLEIFVIPGFGIAGIGGISCLVLSIFLAMFELPDIQGGVDSDMFFEIASPAIGNLAIGIVAFGMAAVAALTLLPNTRFWRRLSLGTAMTQEAGFVSVSVELDQWIGRDGKARSTLRPGGMVEIDGQRLDAVSEGDFIQKGEPVRVLRIDGAQLVVEATSGDEA